MLQGRREARAEPPEPRGLLEILGLLEPLDQQGLPAQMVRMVLPGLPARLVSPEPLGPQGHTAHCGKYPRFQIPLLQRRAGVNIACWERTWVMRFRSTSATRQHRNTAITIGSGTLNRLT